MTQVPSNVNHGYCTTLVQSIYLALITSKDKIPIYRVIFIVFYSPNGLHEIHAFYNYNNYYYINCMIMGHICGVALLYTLWSLLSLQFIKVLYVAAVRNKQMQNCPVLPLSTSFS